VQAIAHARDHDAGADRRDAAIAVVIASRRVVKDSDCHDFPAVIAKTDNRVAVSHFAPISIVHDTLLFRRLYRPQRHAGGIPLSNAARNSLRRSFDFLWIEVAPIRPLGPADEIFPLRCRQRRDVWQRIHGAIRHDPLTGLFVGRRHGVDRRWPDESRECQAAVAIRDVHLEKSKRPDRF
jgi:hypothetical protein